MVIHESTVVAICDLHRKTRDWKVRVSPKIARSRPSA